MSSWMQERDRLMAQTLAFVQGVTGARPEVVAKPVDATPPAHPSPVAEALPNDIVVQQPPAPPNGSDAPDDIRVTPDRAARNDDIAASATAILSASSTPPRPQRLQPAPPNESAARPISTGPRQTPLTVASEREDILKRVAAFRAQQSRLSRDRETYYEDMRAKIAQKLGTDGDKVLP